jgi:hypothetical protein
VTTYAPRTLRCILAAALVAALAAPAAFAQTSGGVSAGLMDRAAAATGATWSDLLRTDDLGVQLDTARVERRDDGALLVWMRFEYAEDEPVPGATDRTFSRLEIREALDCGEQRVADVEAVLRDDAERVVGTTRAEAPRWTTFAEHPFDADLFILACRYLTPRVASR